jgi:hypothetical protein
MTRTATLFVLLGLGAGACTTTTTVTPTMDAGPDADMPLPACDLHAGQGTTFADATMAWGLGGVVGNRITSADLDGDGYPDLVINGNTPNKRNQPVKVLMNRPNGAGRTFVDATQASGFFQVRGGMPGDTRSAHVSVFADVDNDGDLDAFSGTYVDATNPMTDPGDRSELLINDGKGVFTLAPISDPHPTASQLWPTTGATFTDADRDGKIDLFVGFWYERYGQTEYGVQAQLYQGKGDGTFASMTKGSGLETNINGFAAGTNHRPAYGVTSCDVDGDGAPELLVSAYGRQWNMLYQNDGTAHFTDVGKSSGFAGDANLNYSDNQFFACYCTLHQTQPDCVGVAAPIVSCPMPADSYWRKGADDQPWRLNGNTFSTLCDDLDGDGDLDLYSAEIHHWHIGQSSDSSELLRNNGSFQFERPGNTAMGMAWPHPTSDWNEGGLMVGGGDLDQDGLEDIVVAASDYPDQFSLVFHQKQDHTFEEVGEAWGFHHACASGLTLADFDRDGDLDVVVGSGTARDCAKIWTTNEVHLYENKGQGQKWLEVKLSGDGTTTNKAGIGARVTVTTGGGTVVKELGGGYGHMGMHHDAGWLTFGLGQCPTAHVEVRWPNADLVKETWKNVASNAMVELRQGDKATHALH